MAEDPADRRGKASGFSAIARKRATRWLDAVGNAVDVSRGVWARRVAAPTPPTQRPPIMNSVNVLIPVLAAAAFLGACTPFPEPLMRQGSVVPGQAPNRTLTDADQQMIREQRLKAAEDARIAEIERQAIASGTSPAGSRTPGGTSTNNPGLTQNPTQGAGTTAMGSGSGTGSGTGSTDPTKPAEPKKEYPYATKVPGKDGFVLSPYNTKVIDVRDIPAGTLVQDPNYPASEKKYFRIP